VPIEDAIDLHFFAPADISSVGEAYLDAAADAGFAEVSAIHGRGKGVPRLLAVVDGVGLEDWLPG